MFWNAPRLNFHAERGAVGGVEVDVARGHQNIPAALNNFHAGNAGLRVHFRNAQPGIQFGLQTSGNDGIENLQHFVYLKIKSGHFRVNFGVADCVGGGIGDAFHFHSDPGHVGAFAGDEQ